MAPAVHSGDPEAIMKGVLQGPSKKRYHDIVERGGMAQLVVRNLDDDVKAKLQQLARQHGRSTEEEVREILRNAVQSEPQKVEPLGKRLRALFGDIGLEENILEWRGQPAEPATF